MECSCRRAARQGGRPAAEEVEGRTRPSWALTGRNAASTPWRVVHRCDDCPRDGGPEAEESGERARRRRTETGPSPGIVAAVAVGIAIGGWAGATMRGSGMLYTNLFVAACLIVVCAVVGLGALAATLTHQPGAARVLAGFTGAAVVATGIA